VLNPQTCFCTGRACFPYRAKNAPTGARRVLQWAGLANAGATRTPSQLACTVVTIPSKRRSPGMQPHGLQRTCVPERMNLPATKSAISIVLRHVLTRFTAKTG
jgi:hypothetical protein